VRGLVRRWALRAAALAAAAIAGIIAFGFLSLSLYLALCHSVPRPAAALLTALADIVVAAVTVYAATRSGGRTTNAAGGAPAGPTGDSELAAQLGRLAGQQLGSLGTRPEVKLGIALAAGFALGVSPRLRRLLFNLLR
jgi:hypothetical protein